MQIFLDRVAISRSRQPRPGALPAIHPSTSSLAASLSLFHSILLEAIHSFIPSVAHPSTNQMTAASLRRWPLSRTGHCVIDPLVPWASISSSSSARPSSIHLQQTVQITRSYRQHRYYQYTSRTHIQRSPYNLSTTTKPASNTTIITPPHTRTMSSDNDYMSFLNKANADLNASQFQPQRDNTSSTPRTQTIHTNVRVPTPLTSVDAFYVSETDEPFEPVALKWPDAGRGIWPDAGELSVLSVLDRSELM